MEIRTHRLEVIHTNRLILRELNNSDLDNIFEWASDEEVCKYLTWYPHESKDTTKQILNYWLKQYECNPLTFRFGITLKDGDRLIGSIDVIKFEEGSPEIGYCLNRNYWNHGYMSEALKGFIDYLKTFKIKKILIKADTDNIASNRVILKNGFTFLKQEKHTNKGKERIINYYELII